MKSFTKFLLSSIVLLNATSLLAMDIGKGAEALGEEFGIYGKRVTPNKAPVVATAVAYSPVGSNVFSSSSAAIVGQRAVPVTAATAAIAAVAVDETGEENDTNTFLEKEICDNIYQRCLAKVATMSLSERASVDGVLGISKEAKEWSAAERKAIRDVEKRKKELVKATKERTIAYKEMESADASFHGRDYVSKASADFKIKELAEQLAEARVSTAEATLFAIQEKDTAQSAGAEADLTEAIEEEKQALQALEEAQAHGPLEQNLASSSIPMAEAIAVEAFAVYPDHHSYEAYPHHQQFNALNISPEKSAQERKEALAQKEKAAHEFETEFSAMIKNAEAQAEKAVEAATTAREKVEKPGALEKDWNDVIKKATKAEAAYAHLVGYYTMYKEQTAEHYEGGMLKAKRSQYNFALQDAESERDDWTTALEECREKKEALHNGTAGKAQEEARAAEAKTAQEREALELQKKRTEDEADLLAKQKELAKEKEILAREEALAQREAEAAKNQEKIKREEAAVLAREREVLEPVFKVAEADEGQGVDGAQKLSVQELRDASSTGATKPFAASVEFEDRFLEATNKVKLDKEAAAAAQAKILALEQTRAAEAKAAQEREAATAAAAEAQAQASAQGQQMIIAKKREGEAAFAKARAEKSASGWNEAKTAAMSISNYWKEVVEAIKAGRNPLALSQEEVTIQKDYWMEKAGVAEVKELGVSPLACKRGEWVEKLDRADAMMAMIKDRVWPFVSQAMKAFSNHPSEARMLAVREITYAYTSASASVYAYAYASAHYASTYDSAYAYAYASASAYAYISAHAYAYTYASAYASPYAPTFGCAQISGFGHANTSASAYAYASASASAAASASASASEALQIASVADDVVNDTEGLAEAAKKNSQRSHYQLVTINFSISATRETANFARAVAKYKETGYREQVTGDSKENKSQDHAVVIAARKAFSTAKALKNEDIWRNGREALRDAWQKAGVAVREAIEATQQKDYWTEQANLADVKALSTTPYDNNGGHNSQENLDRANAIMTMTREKFGSPISPSMKEFMLHPSEATLKATGKSALIAMSSAEAEEALEGVEVFAKASTDRAALAKEDNWGASYQENMNLSAAVTTEVAEFYRAVAAFKRAEEAAKQP